MIKDRASEIVTSLIKQAITELTCNTADEDEFEDALQELVVGLLMFENADSILVIETTVDEIAGGTGDLLDLFTTDYDEDEDDYDDDEYDEDDFTFGTPWLNREIL